MINRQIKSKLPPGARAILIDNPIPIGSSRKPIADRLVGETSQSYINMMIQLDEIFAESNPFFPEPYFGQWYVLIDLLDLSSAYSKENAKDIKCGQVEYSNKLREIQESANKLANMLRVVQMNGPTYGCTVDVSWLASDLLLDAAENTCEIEKKCLFEQEIKPDLEKILNRYDSPKYWPSIVDVLSELSRQIGESNPYLYDQLPKQIHERNAILTKFFQLLNQKIKHNQMSPAIKKLKNKEWCELFSIAFGEDTFTEQILKDFKPKNP